MGLEAIEGPSSYSGMAYDAVTTGLGAGCEAAATGLSTLGYSLLGGYNILTTELPVAAMKTVALGGTGILMLMKAKAMAENNGSGKLDGIGRTLGGLSQTNRVTQVLTKAAGLALSGLALPAAYGLATSVIGHVNSLTCVGQLPATDSLLRRSVQSGCV